MFLFLFIDVSHLLFLLKPPQVQLGTHDWWTVREGFHFWRKSSQMTNAGVSRHSDILHVSPDTEEKKEQLLNELKSRGNHAFSSKSFEEAEVLYSRSIELNPKDHTIYSNRSAARCSMGKYDKAAEDAEECITLQPVWAKGYFRKGQVLAKLNKHGEAVQAFKKAVQLEPTNKSAAQYMKTAETKAAELGQDSTKQIVETNNASKKVTVPTKTSTTTSKPASKPKEKKSEELGGVVRGYKKTADGRTTTFFNNELTEEAKALIGDIAPKRIENASAVQIQNVKGASAWNAGSTFEERVMTPWAKDRLKSIFNAMEVRQANGPEEETVISITKMEAIEGDASIAVMRGKKRHLFDLSFKLNCSGKFGDEKEDKAEGVLTFSDVSSDCNDVYEAHVAVKSRYSTSGGKKLHAALSNESSAFREKILSTLKNFRLEYETL